MQYCPCSGACFVFDVAWSWRSTGCADQAAAVVQHTRCHTLQQEASPFGSFAQTLYLNASNSMDDDQLDGVAIDFTWTCTDGAGGDCESSSGPILDIGSFASGALLSVPADALPIGEIKWYNGITSHREECECLRCAISVITSLRCQERLGWRTPYVRPYHCILDVAARLPAQVSTIPSASGPTLAKPVLSTGQSSEAMVPHAQYLLSGRPCLKFSCFPRCRCLNLLSRSCNVLSWKRTQPGAPSLDCEIATQRTRWGSSLFI